MSLGNEDLLKSRRSYAAVNRLKDLGTGVYTVGFNLRNTADIDEISSKPISEFRTLYNNPVKIGEEPGMYVYSMLNGKWDTFAFIPIDQLLILDS